MRRRIFRATTVVAMVAAVSGTSIYALGRPVAGHVAQSLAASVEPAPKGVELPASPPPQRFESALGVATPSSRILIGTGRQANAPSDASSLSQNGRYVAFVSAATNLVAGGAPPGKKIFWRDLETGTTEIVSGDVAGEASSPSVSTDGRYIAFAVRDRFNVQRVYVRDRSAGRTMPISLSVAGILAEGYGPAIAADGSAVAFVSSSADLVPADGNGVADVFVRDFHTGKTDIVSISSRGEQADAEAGTDGVVAISADGLSVVFASGATNLAAGDDGTGGIDVFVRDRATRTTTMISTPSSPELTRRNSFPAISGDGAVVAYVRHVESATTPPHDIVLAWSRSAGRERIASVSSSEAPINTRTGVAPSLSTSGRFLAFASSSGRVFVRDRSAGTTTQESLGELGAPAPSGCGLRSVSISGGGGYVAFDCGGPLVSIDTNDVADVFVRDRRRLSTVRASVGSAQE